MTVGDFNTPLSIINRTTTLNTTKNEDINYTINQTDPTDMLKKTLPNNHRTDIFLKYSCNIL